MADITTRQTHHVIYELGDHTVTRNTVESQLDSSTSYISYTISLGDADPIELSADDFKDAVELLLTVRNATVTV